jgi:hypothetical protein
MAKDKKRGNRELKKPKTAAKKPVAPSQATLFPTKPGPGKGSSK